MPPDKNYAFARSHRGWECMNPVLDTPNQTEVACKHCSFLLSRSYSGFSTKKSGARMPKANQKENPAQDRKGAFPDRPWHVSICSCSTKRPSLSSPIGARDSTSFITVSAVLL